MSNDQQKITNSTKSSNTKRALFFTPFAGVVPHSIPEATVANELQKAGFKVDHITCGELLKGQCIVLDAHGLSKNPPSHTLDTTCRACQSCAKSLFKNQVSLNELLDSKNLADVKTKVSNLISTITRENFADFEYDGLSLGKIAAYQHMLHFKKFTPEIDPREFPIFLRELENCLWVYFALNQYLMRNPELPDIGFVYNSLYSVNAVFRLFFERKGVRIISLHAGANLHHFLDTMLLMEKSTFTHLANLKNMWPEFDSRRLSKKRSDWVLDHFKELSAGKSVFAYSAPAQKAGAPDIRIKWNIPSEKKICLVALSSYDERFAAEYTGVLTPSKDAIFTTQIDWVKSIKDYAVNREDIHFIIRLHPREFPNKRESVQSKHAALVIEALKDCPHNLSINTPADNLSLYDIARDVDLALTSWSSVGKELMLIGIPLVLYTADSQFYPASLAKIATNRAEYFQLIEQMINEGWSIKNSTKIFKWLAFETIDNTFKLTTRLSSARLNKFTRLFWRVIDKLLGPAAGLTWRLGRVVDRKVLVSVVREGRLPVAYREQENDNGSIAEKDLEITVQALHQLGEIFFGPRDQWPSKFTLMLENSHQVK